MPGPLPAAHQVLVYSGPGVSPLSLSHTVLTLSLLLNPHYTVQPVTTEVLANQPWEPACALLVIPGGRDLPYVEELTTKTNITKRIRVFVEEGGRYLGICAGAYFGADEVRFDVGGGLEVSGKRDLGFVSGFCTGPTFPGFAYAAESGSRAVSLLLGEGSSSGQRRLDHIYYNGGGHFVLPSPQPRDVEVIARYAESTSTVDQPIAAVLSRKGKGKALLNSVHAEYPLSDPPARDAIAKLDKPPTNEELQASDARRIEWMEELLLMLDLKPPGRRKDSSPLAVDGEEDPSILLHPTHPSPIFVLSHPALPQLASQCFDSATLLSKTVREGDGRVLRDGNDELRLTTVDAFGPDAQTSVTQQLAKRRRSPPPMPPAVENLSVESSEPAPPQPPDFHAIPKTIFVPSDQSPYQSSWTPLFNIDTYWAELDQARKRIGRKSGVLRKDHAGGQRGAVGDLLWYGETVTSTQTMLDRNPLILTHLPTPVAFLASFQLSGRGRGSNIWLSPSGCLQHSLLLTLPSSMSSKIVFIQYLMALAVCEAIDEDGRLGVRVKWPNDIYAECEGVGGTAVGSGQKGRAKLGGILVNTNFVGGQWRIVIGTGINVLNALPTTSLSQLHSLLAGKSPEAAIAPPPMEGTFARIMNAFEVKWDQFIEEGGFDGFMDEYMGRWLHSGQEVTLTTTEPHTPLRILGITPDHGLLRCLPIGGSTAKGPSGLTPLYSRGDFGDDDRSRGKQQYVDLQPDGNSFDLMSGLIKRKQ